MSTFFDGFRIAGYARIAQNNIYLSDLQYEYPQATVNFREISIQNSARLWQAIVTIFITTQRLIE